LVGLQLTVSKKDLVISNRTEFVTKLEKYKNSANELLNCLNQKKISWGHFRSFCST